MQKETALSQIAKLPQMNPLQLQELWEELFGEKPPQVNRVYLQRRLAYRIQELAFGGVSGLDERLEMLNRRHRSDRHRPRAKPFISAAPGTKLLREYKGVEHHITVLPDGFEYNGMLHRSLTQIAEKITGQKISGPAFFGLTQQTKRAKA